MLTMITMSDTLHFSFTINLLLHLMLTFCAALDHSVLRHGRVLKGPLEEDGWRDNVCLRVCELRDEVVTEPTMRVTPCTEESLQQQLYTRPGRARGTRRKGQLSAEVGVYLCLY